MSHDCINWTTRPPTRKLPFLVLTHGNHHIYTPVPNELKALEDIARKEFDLGDTEVAISSACVNLCNGQLARITESAWEQMRPYIGSLAIYTSSALSCKAYLPVTRNERVSTAKQNPPLNTDQGNDNERPEDRSEDHGNDHHGASPLDDQHEEPWEEEVSAISPRKPRIRRRVVSEDEDESKNGESEREQEISARSQLPIVTSTPAPDREKDSGHRSQPNVDSAGLLQPSNATKRASQISDGRTQPPQTQVESNEVQKLMIRVAHQPSKQESKFTTKSSTRVAKVLAAACKSFGLDADQATLCLIVPLSDGDDEDEVLFPCDMNDSIARAGAECDTESRFLIKIKGEAET